MPWRRCLCVCFFLHLHYTTHYTYFSSALALILLIPFLFSQCFFFFVIYNIFVYFFLYFVYSFLFCLSFRFVVFLFPHNFPIQWDMWMWGDGREKRSRCMLKKKRQRNSMEKTRQVHFFEIRRKKRILNWLSSLQGPVCSAYACLLCFIKSYLNDAFFINIFCRCYVSSPGFLSPRMPREIAKMEVDIFLYHSFWDEFLLRRSSVSPHLNIIHMATQNQKQNVSSVHHLIAN